MDDDDEFISVGEPIPRLLSVKAGDGRTVIVEWEDGGSAAIDLTSLLSHKAFRDLDDTNFSEVEIEEYRWAIYWPSSPSAAIPTTTLQELERGTYGARDATGS